jgi:alanine transaminase
MEQILRFAHERSLMVMADEVYQENIWSDKKWHSFREILMKMPEPFRSDIELASFHSASKGYMGECGVRGGYMELLNMDPVVYQMVNKVSGIELCSNTTGQVMVDLMINPPSQKMGESAETVESFRAEADKLSQSLKRRANVAYTALNSMENVSSNPVEGALYALAKVDFSQKFIKEAELKGVAPDFLYCMQALEETGCILVPGSGFKQAPGTHHFRTTILPLPEERFTKTFEKLQAFNKKFHSNN